MRFEPAIVELAGDPRQKFEAFSFTEGINKPEDLKPGMKLAGIVTNVTAFGRRVNADGSFTATLFLPNRSGGEESFESLTTPEAVLALFERRFADAIPLMPAIR